MARLASRTSMDPSAAGVALSVILVAFLLIVGSALIWALSGSPLVIPPEPNPLVVEFGLCVGLATAIFMRLKRLNDGVALGILVFGITAFCVYQFNFLYDLSTASVDRHTRLFVEAVWMEGMGKGRPIIPEVTVSGEGGVRKLNAPSRFAGSLVPGDSCLEASVAHGRHGFEFVHAIVRSSGDGTGSYMVADQNRERCLGNGKLQ